jgi:hypothetical protein
MTQEVSKAPVRLHLGCGADYWPGYVNIDGNPSSPADLKMDYLGIDTLFAPGTVREVAMIHSLNYLTLWQARDFFRKTLCLLDGEGVLVVETVCLEKAIQQIERGVGNLDAYLEGVRALHAFGLEQLRDREIHVPNAFSWTAWHLTEELSTAGFSNILVLPPRTHAAWRDMRIEAYKGSIRTEAGHD